MKKYLVIGNPINHSLSPELHNYWIKQNKISAVYEKRLIDTQDIESILADLKNDKISGINVTVPFKKAIIPYLDKLSSTAKETASVNTIYKSNNQLCGDNTDIGGFRYSLERLKFSVKGKKALVIGAGGVAPSIIFALNIMGATQINLINRTKKKAEDLKKQFPFLEIFNWGETIVSDIIINATSIGLQNNDKINLDYSKIGTNRLYYDVIYNPTKTNFLKQGEKFDNKVENGKFMFIYQAQLAFEIWHQIKPKIDDKVLELLKND